MKAEYKDIQREADHLFHRTESMMDDKSHEMAEYIARQARDVREAVESDKPPRTIEDRIRQVQQSLSRLKAAPTGVMSPQDADQLEDDYEDLRRHCRSLPNY